MQTWITSNCPSPKRQIWRTFIWCLPAGLFICFTFYPGFYVWLGLFIWQLIERGEKQRNDDLVASGEDFLLLFYSGFAQAKTENLSSNSGSVKQCSSNDNVCWRQGELRRRGWIEIEGELPQAKRRRDKTFKLKLFFSLKQVAVGCITTRTLQLEANWKDWIFFQVQCLRETGLRVNTTTGSS